MCCAIVLSLAVLFYLNGVVFLNNTGFYGTCPATAALAVSAALSFPLLRHFLDWCIFFSEQPISNVVPPAAVA